MSISSLETTKKNIRTLRKKLLMSRELVEKVTTSKEEGGTTSLLSALDLSLTRSDANRMRALRIKRRRMKRAGNLIMDISSHQSKDNTKLNLITDVRSEDECLSFDDDVAAAGEEDNETAAAAAEAAASLPKNDYNQHFVDTGQRPQNFIRDPGLNERFQTMLLFSHVTC